MRWVIYLAVVLLVVLFVMRQCTGRAPEPRAVAEPPAPAVQASTPVPAASRSERAPPKASVAPAQPAVVPGTPETDLAAPPANDPIEPEEPQTPEWKLDKTVHMQELLSRHLERLEQERAAAHAAGNAQEELRLGVAIARGRARLYHLQGETTLLRRELAH